MGHGFDGTPFRASARVGDLILVLGMIGRGPDGTILDGIVAQTRLALERVEEVLAGHGVDRSCIVRIRAFVTDIREWPEARQAIVEFFEGDVPPALVAGVTALVEPAVRIEIEVDASAEPGS